MTIAVFCFGLVLILYVLFVGDEDRDTWHDND
jgi:hypothetical protein